MRLDHLLSKEYSQGNEAVLQVDQRTDRKRRELRESGDIPQARTPTGNRGESDKEDTRRNHGDCAKQPVSFSGFAGQSKGNLAAPEDPDRTLTTAQEDSEKTS